MELVIQQVAEEEDGLSFGLVVGNVFFMNCPIYLVRSQIVLKQEGLDKMQLKVITMLLTVHIDSPHTPQTVGQATLLIATIYANNDRKGGSFTFLFSSRIAL
jgi:hypothetical protein